MSNPLNVELDPEELLTCPYNESHRIRRMKLQYHLKKCSKAYPSTKKIDCPFNSCHRINEQEFQFHIETCPDKGSFNSFIYVSPEQDPVVPPIPDTVIPPCDENWDNEYSETYDPSIKVSGQAIVHSFIGGTKSERKKTRIRERQKFRALEESNSNVQQPSVSSVLEDQPLRRPKSLPASIANESLRFKELNDSISNDPFNMGTLDSELPSLSTSDSSSDRKDVSGKNNESDTKPGPSQSSENDFVVARSQIRRKKRIAWNK